MTDNMQDMTGMERIKVGIVYPTDPLGAVIGGVDSFIRGLIKYAPEDIEYVVYGATTDPVARPVRQWVSFELGGKECRLFPVIQIDGSGCQPRIPATITYEVSFLLHAPDLSECDVLESHRIEHFILRGADQPVNLFLHQDMAVLEQGRADIRWRLMPALYRKLEMRVLHKTSSIYCVRENAVNGYKTRYPFMTERFNFQSTWMDPEIFYPPGESERPLLRQRLGRELGVPTEPRWLIAVGRLDYQKDPLLMVRAFSEVEKEFPDIHLVWVGAGVLKDEVMNEIRALGLSDKMTLAGLLRPDEVADLHRAGDMFVMSSAYEGMPIALIEAMACGLPAVTTDVGEVRRVVSPGCNGEICVPGDASEMAQAMLRGLRSLEAYRGRPCVESAARYTPQKVLQPVYANYRELVRGRRYAS